MPSKQVLKDIQRLGLKKGRAGSGRFLAEGPKVVGELLAAIPEAVESVYALPQWIDAHAAAVPDGLLQPVTPEELARISQLQTPNEVLLVARQLPAREPVLQRELALYLDAIQDPGNLGTIIRIADWFGIRHIVCGPGCAELYNPKVVQSTMASLARVNIWYDEEDTWLSRQTLPVLAAVLGGTSVYEYSGNAGGILLIGNESKGLRPELQERATVKLTIPRIGGAESLNAAVATGIMLSELTKPR
ncbi:RNA methyltransferase [Flaviaesturariibacter flavus]|uniref:RNA methyltransferase n=1 Tax=Flaviaesturariibacter flavus TaxID=2502780 RepID=A0A4R1BHB3_9BACT|nr:RNA methyltransferase [Flaviaesturariibacter flavus]TCJ16557.1 RNA methyltransferase [Flaviaesturariibacter flavus]